MPVATTEIRRFTLSMGSLYGGLAANIVYLVVGYDGTVLADTTNASGSNVTEKTGGAGNITFTGQYEAAIPNFDTSWRGVIYLKETTTGITDSQAFSPQQPTIQPGSIASATFAAGATIPAVTTAGSVAGSVGSVTAAVTVGTNNDKAGYALTTGEHTNIQSDVATSLSTTAVPIRAQEGVTAPTYADAMLGAWSVAFAAQTDNSIAIPPSFVVYKPGGAGAGAARTFGLTNNTSGQPVARS